MMRLKRAVALIGSALLVLIIFMIYSAKDLTELAGKKAPVVEFESMKLVHIENKLKQMEHDLSQHANDVEYIKSAIKNMQQTNSSMTVASKNLLISTKSKSKTVITEMKYESHCPIQLGFVPKTDVQMLEMYKRLKLDDNVKIDSQLCASKIEKMSWVDATITPQIANDKVIEETSVMEFTCQIPTILKKQNSTLSNVELTDDNSHLSKPCTTSTIKKIRDDRTSISKIRNDDTIVTPSDMEFTCQMPIASKLSTTGTSEIEKMSWADITFRSQVVNDNDYCELSTTSGTSKVEKMSWADITNVSKVGTDNTVTTSPFGKFTYQTPASKKEKSVVDDMKFNCESSKTGFKSENTENNKAGVCDISADCKESRLEKISWGNVTTNQVLESEKKNVNCNLFCNFINFFLRAT